MQRFKFLHRIKAAALLLLPALALLSAAAVQAANLRVAVASNFAPVLESLAPLFTAGTGHTLTLIPGATGLHYTQITNGAPFDVFLAADAERPARLESEGHGLPGTRFTYALGKLVLWSAEPGYVDANGAVLGTAEFRRLAIANPRLAPYGEAAREVLDSLGLWEALQDRLVQGENITQTLQFIQSGNAELGFIAKSQWLALDAGQQGSAWEVPPELHAALPQQAILLRDSAAARAFAMFLQDDRSRSLIEAAGYELP